MIKRAFDGLLASSGILASLPLWAAIAAAVKLEDGGQVFYAQERVGLHGRPFTALKFRSMKPDAEAGLGAVQAADDDARVTRVGRVLRATAMDELRDDFLAGTGFPMKEHRDDAARQLSSRVQDLP